MTRINPNIAQVECSKTGQVADHGGFSRPLGLCSCCPAPGKPLVFRYDNDRVRAELGGGGLRRSGASGMWTYEALLPVREVPRARAGDVGGTSIVESDALSEELGVTVYLKNEASNPTSSFKDRGLAMGIALGQACGALQFCLPTQGNAGVAAAFYSSRFELPAAIVHMPDGYQGSIYHRAAEFFGAQVDFFGSNIAATGKRMREQLADRLQTGELVDISTFFEPGRLEGKKTMGFEIADHFGGDLPDWIFYPTGGGTGLVGIWKAFDELRELGQLRDGVARSRMVAVQSVRCAPVVESFVAGLDHVQPVTSRGTIADGLDVPGAIMGHAILGAIRESGGTAVAVEEAAIEDAFGRYGALAIPGGYESAATLAGLRALRANGTVADGARVLLLNTGSHMIALARGSARQP